MVVLGKHRRLLTGDLELRVICNVIDDLILPKARYLEKSILISLLEVCQECGSRRLYLEDVEGS